MYGRSLGTQTCPHVGESSTDRGNAGGVRAHRGSRGAPLRPHIVGGHEASENYAFIASLRIDGQAYCGAALIDPRWLLTAAHCVPPVEGDVTARIGSNDRTIGGVEARVSKRVAHPGFDWRGPDDIALLKLDRRVGFAPIDRATTVGGPGAPARIMGWGMTCDPGVNGCPENGRPPIKLQELDTRLVADRDCVDVKPAGDLCARSDTPNAQACGGDSGGPMIVGRPGDWRLAGVASRGGDTKPRCGSGPNVWTDASAYAKWIDRTLAAQ